MSVLIDWQELRLKGVGMILGVLDIETTGIDKRFHRIIEVGVV